MKTIKNYLKTPFIKTLQLGTFLLLFTLTSYAQSGVIFQNPQPTFNQVGTNTFNNVIPITPPLPVSAFNTRVVSCNTARSYCPVSQMNFVPVNNPTRVSPQFAMLIRPNNGGNFDQLFISLVNPVNGATAKVLLPDLLPPNQHNFKDPSAWLLKIELDKYWNQGISIEPGQPIVEVHLEGIQNGQSVQESRRMYIRN